MKILQFYVMSVNSSEALTPSHETGNYNSCPKKFRVGFAMKRFFQISLQIDWLSQKKNLRIQYFKNERFPGSGELSLSVKSICCFCRRADFSLITFNHISRFRRSETSNFQLLPFPIFSLPLFIELIKFGPLGQTSIICPF